MDMFVIRGGRRLAGAVAVSGSKNAALPILAATLAVDGPCLLHNVPDLADIRTLAELLGTLQVEVRRTRTGAMQIVHQGDSACVADYELVRKMRAGISVLGPLLGRRGRACVSLPGGCNIGHRPIDLHLKGLAALGAEIRIERGYVIAEADRLHGADIYLGGPCGSTVTGTCNVMTAAVFAEGTTTIEAAACEPEVVDLGQFLISAGARISGLGTPTLRIEGVDRLSGCEHTVIPDRIEAATLMIAGAITRSSVEITHVEPAQLTAVIEKLREIGVGIECRGDALAVDGSGSLTAAECIALPHPALPTDIQAQLTALLSTAEGISIVTDKVFPDRFMHIAELARMGARVRREGASAIISGPARLSGAAVMASDLRASAALVLAGLAADGPSIVRRIYHLDRGYESLETKLRSLGADVQRTRDHADHIPLELADPLTPARPAAPHFATHPSRKKRPA
ncbi:MAG: UDP-N-acetylglucosamine 1-carboxyvinyltransferase [Planctomycetota bacterium]|nr:MAG: UDP-N-acetylglucosamine 1-carboxyvinyltransferase [Planctomycetota bacterium]